MSPNTPGAWDDIRRRFLRLLLGMMIAAFTLVIVDRALFVLSPHLPEKLVRRLSTHAQLRWVRRNPSLCPYVYGPNIQYGNPEVDSRCDELGYRNPLGYLGSLMRLDVLLLGDSFIWGTEKKTVADHLRIQLAPWTVYSAAVGGNGPPHWRFHLQRVLQEGAALPHIVVLNYYAGNDWTETDYFLRMQRSSDPVDSAEYRVFVCSGKYHELQMPPLSQTVRLWELRHLIRSAILIGPSWESRPPVVLENVVSRFWIQREPDPGSVQWDKLGREIKACVNAIRRAGPDTLILLSYIPSCTSIYGSLIINYPESHQDVERQHESSAKLSQIAEALSISYVDTTPHLQQAARSGQLLWQGVHFNAKGYELYSQLLGDALLQSFGSQSNDVPIGIGSPIAEPPFD